MRKTRDKRHRRRGGGGGALTSFPSPSTSSSSSDFEFTVSVSPSSGRSACPADELFYKGQLLPLHLSPRISMVRTLILASSSTSSSSDATTTASRDSNGSSSSSSSSSFSAADLHLLLPPDCDSSRPSSVTEEDAPRPASRRPNYFSSFATRFSSVFLHRGSKKEPSPTSTDEIPASPPPVPTPPPKKEKPPTNTTAREMLKKYVKKVKPLYEKLSLLQQKQNQTPNQNQSQSQSQKKNFSFSIRRDRADGCTVGSGTKKCEVDRRGAGSGGRTAMMYSHNPHSFSGNLRYPRRKKCAGSCPSSMRSSPSHSGLLYGFQDPPTALSAASSSSMEELQNAIQGAIAHCKSTMMNQTARQKAAAVLAVGES